MASDDQDPTNQRPSSSPRQYKCGHCPKAFKRSEHCIRHERRHTLEKPFSCRYCRKSYSRKDLVTRHERTLHADKCTRTNPHAPPKALVASANEGDTVHCAQHPTIRRDSLLEPLSSLDENAWIPPACRHTDPLPPRPSGVDEDVGSRFESIGAMNGPQPAARHHSMPTPPSRRTSTSEPVCRTPNVSPSARSHNGLAIGSPNGSTAPDVGSEPSDNRSVNGQDCEPPYRVQYPRHQDPQQQAPAMPDPLVLQDPAEGQLSLPLLDFGPLPDDLFDVADFDQIEIPDWMELSWTATPVMGTAGTSRGPHATFPDEALRVQDTHGSSPRDHRAIATPTNPHVPKERNGGLNEAFTADVHVRDWICQDLVQRHVPEHQLEEIPTEKLCQGFLSSYMDCFHGHFPIIHRPTFTPTTTPSPLLLIMCSIGALYRLDRRRAKSLYDITVRSIEQMTSASHNSVSHADYPIWFVQTKLLLTLFTVLSGDDELVSTAMAENGFYTLVYETIRQSLNDQGADHRTLSWPEWIQHETRKRTLGGIFIVSTLNMIIYNVNPGFHPAEDLDFEAFDDESHWNAKTTSEWCELRTAWHQPDYLTMREMLMDLISDDSSRLKNRSRVSPFSAWVITHAFVVYTWHLFQVAPPTSSAILGANVTSLLLHSAMQSLARYHELLEESVDTNPEEVTHTAKPSLISTCRAILPIAYIRLFGSAIRLDRLSLISRDSDSVEASVAVFASTKMIKTPYLLDVVRRSFDGLRRTVKIGHLLMRKTAAFHWSVEHAVAAWDCALFVTKWVHAVELDALNDILTSPAEAQLLDSMKQVLDETDCSFREGLSLAAALARLWSLSLQDVWVWGITPRMGTILSSLATTYQRINDTNRHRSLAEGGLSH